MSWGQGRIRRRARRWRGRSCGELIDRRITTLVATHYSELKAFAQTTPGVRNASMEFDLETLRPTYHLTIGLPGRSNALAIAERLGLGHALIERAQALVSPEDLQSERLLDEIHRQRDLARSARQEAESLRSDVREQEAELTARLEAVEEEQRHVLEAARQQAQAELETLHARRSISCGAGWRQPRSRSRL